jgi:hypothetical protein
VNAAWYTYALAGIGALVLAAGLALVAAGVLLWHRTRRMVREVAAAIRARHVAQLELERAEHALAAMQRLHEQAATLAEALKSPPEGPVQ